MISKSEYRKNYEEELNKEKEKQGEYLSKFSSGSEDKNQMLEDMATASSETEKALEIMRDKSQGDKTRSLAIQKLDISINQNQNLLDELIQILGDEKEDDQVRKSALLVLKQSS